MPTARWRRGWSCARGPGALEGRMTGARQRCTSVGCPGWFVAITWETGQSLKACSEGWHYDPTTKETRITGGGEISGRVISPAPLGVDPLPKEEWPPRAALAKRKGWRTRRGGLIGNRIDTRRGRVHRRRPAGVAVLAGRPVGLPAARCDAPGREDHRRVGEQRRRLGNDRPAGRERGRRHRLRARGASTGGIPSA